MNALNVIYTGVATPYIPIAPNQNLQLILQNIDLAINNMSSAPDYSGYNLYCVKEVDGTTHPTNTQNFAEGISKMLCDLKTAYTVFTGTTYIANNTVYTNAINALQSPALTYTPFSITNTDTIQQVYTKLFAGFTGYNTALNPSGGNWGTLSITAPTTVTGGFNSLIAYISSMNTTIAGKQASIANFNNSANCLSGTSSDTIRATVALLISYTCDLPTYDNNSITWGGVSPGTDLQSAIQAAINSISSILTNGVFGQGTGLTITSIGSTYQGKKLAIDPTWTGLAKVAISSSDTGGYLNTKITSKDATITIDTTTDPTVLDLSITSPTQNQVKVDTRDTTPGYLQDKIIPAAGTWGLSVNIAPSTDDKRLNVSGSISDPDTFITNMLEYISTSPVLLSLYCGLADKCADRTCTAITDLIAARATNDIALTWTATGTATTQQAKYRMKGDVIWQTNNFSPANPLSNSATTTTSQVAGTTDLNKNTVYQYQVDSICGTGTGNSNIYEMIVYATTALSNTIVAGIISVTQNPLSTIANIYYRLKNSSSTVIQSGTATGLAPQLSFTTVASGTYTVEWRFGTVVNGVSLFSDDASQSNAWYVSGSIVVP